MEGFNELLLKLREVHEREMDGWQAKVQELSNKKGCDTKRMEELFNRNQQMKEQQRLLTENIKTLENRLRAGLCDRCTVTQEVAQRRQKEFEVSQMQSLQHITILAGEVNNLKRDNRRLKDEIGKLRAALDSHFLNNSSSSSNTSITEVKQPNNSPDLSSSSGPLALIAAATSRVTKEPPDGDVTSKTKHDQRTEETLFPNRQLKGMSRSHVEPGHPPSTFMPPSWKTEPSVPFAGERAQRVEGLDQRSSIAQQSLLLKNSSSSAGGEVKPSRHVLHAPVPCRPQPIKTSPVTLPWPLCDTSDWASIAAVSASLMAQPPSKPNQTRFPNLIPTSQHTSHPSPRRQALGSHWHKQRHSQSHAKEPTVVVRLKSLTEHEGGQTKPKEKKEITPPKTERVSEEGIKETYEGPLDLSDRGKTPKEEPAIVLQDGDTLQKGPDKDVKTNPPAQVSSVPVSSPSPTVSRSSSSTPPVKQEKESPELNYRQVIKEEERKDDVNAKKDGSNGKKVPILTISLRPVVVLETLNSALQKQESISTNGKTFSPAAEPGSSTEDEKESVSGQERKRKRASVETETDRDSDINNIQQERKVKITVN